MKELVNHNFKAIRLWLLYPALICLLAIFAYLYSQQGSFHSVYTTIQQNLFIFLNKKLAPYPYLQRNITEIGDASVGLSLVSIFLYYAVRFWGALLNASLLSLGTSAGLKSLFLMPRPASIIAKGKFTIIGKELLTKSLPSGHSMTIFIFISLILFAFFPRGRAKIYKLIWVLAVLLIGLFIASSRIAVGAHWPLDVAVGSLIGYCLAVLGIYINNKVGLWAWLEEKRFRPVVIIMILILFGLVIYNKLLVEALPIYYLALFSLLTTLCLICRKLILQQD